MCIGLSDEEAQKKSRLVCPLCDFEARNTQSQVAAAGSPAATGELPPKQEASKAVRRRKPSAKLAAEETELHSKQQKREQKREQKLAPVQPTVRASDSSVVVGAGVPPAETFCVCGAPEGGLYVECAVGTSGCNGWVHPMCIGLSDEEAQKKSRLVCPLCDFGTVV
jgi:hypothetical protein